MKISTASFVTSATSAAQWPPALASDGTPCAEVAVCGRSNVGKSTLLNALLGRRGLARVSSTPGRTRLINFFAVAVIDERPGQPPSRAELRVADLPGFGYAQVSKSERALWRPMMEEYLLRREPLRVVILLCDSRRAVERDAAELLYDEAEIARFLRDHGRLVVPVLTKADKLSKHERKPAAEAAARVLGQRVTPVSAAGGPEGDGMTELWRRVMSALRSSGAPRTPEPGHGAPEPGLGAG